MKRVLALLLCVAMVLSVSACRPKQEEGVPLRPRTSGTDTAATEFPEVTGQPEVRYAVNEYINTFFKQCVALSAIKMDVSTIRRAPGKTDNSEYVATMHECQVTVTDISTKNFNEPYVLQVSILGGISDTTKEAMLTAFSNIIQAVDPSCSKESAEAATEHVAALTTWSGTLNISERVVLMYYTPVLMGDQYRMDLRILDPSLATTTDSVTTTTIPQ